MKWNSTYVRYHQNQILVMFRNHLCPFSFLGLVALKFEAGLHTLKVVETQWLLLPSVQIFQAVSKTTTLRDLFKEGSHLRRKCELKKCMSLCPVITDELYHCPGTIKKKQHPNLKRCKLRMVAKLWILSTPQFFRSVALDLASLHKRDREHVGSVCPK